MSIVMLGIDLAKNVFALHALNEGVQFGHEQLPEWLNRASFRRRAFEDASQVRPAAGELDQLCVGFL